MAAATDSPAAAEENPRDLRLVSPPRIWSINGPDRAVMIHLWLTASFGTAPAARARDQVGAYPCRFPTPERSTQEISGEPEII